jgi:hypothetical protein
MVKKRRTASRMVARAGLRRKISPTNIASGGV